MLDAMVALADERAKHGLFWHKCESYGCEHYIEYDDEPTCFKHSPDSGSSRRGFSARARAELGGDLIEF